MGKKQKKNKAEAAEQKVEEISPDENPGEDRAEFRTPWWMSVVLVGATLVVYANSFWGVFVFDDVPYIVISERIRLDQIPTLRFDRIAERPLMQITLWANYRISKLEPWSYHAVNIGFHLCVGLLLFKLIRETLRLSQFENQLTHRESDWIAFSATLLWLVHPLTTQAVTYTVQRGEIMMSLFYLGIIYSLLRSATSQGVASWTWGVIAFGAAYFGLFSKQVIVTAPVVALLYDYTFLAKNWTEIIRRRCLFYAAVSIPSLILIGIIFQPVLNPKQQQSTAQPQHASQDQGESNTTDNEGPPSGPSAGFQLQSFSKWEYLRTQPEVLLYYMSLAVFPNQLSLDYLWTIEENYVWIAISGLCILVILAIGFRFAWNKHWLGFLILSPFFILAPTSSIVPINDLAVEHRMYLPLAFISILVVIGVRRAFNRYLAHGFMGFKKTQLELTLLAIAVVSLGTRTIVRNSDYYSREQMWRSVITVSPHNARAFTNLGKYFLDTRQPEDAIPYYQRAYEIIIQSNAGDYEVGATLRDVGSAYHDAGQLDKAFEIYSKCLELSKGQDALAFHGLGRILAIRGQFDSAKTAFEKAGELLPNDEKITTDLANLYGQQGKLKKAIEYFRIAKRLDPDNLQLRMNLIGTLEANNQVDEAVKEAQELLPMLDPQSEDYLRTKSWLETH